MLTVLTRPRNNFNEGGRKKAWESLISDAIVLPVRGYEFFWEKYKVEESHGDKLE
jgi:hypothetical protein